MVQFYYSENLDPKANPHIVSDFLKTLESGREYPTDSCISPNHLCYATKIKTIKDVVLDSKQDPGSDKVKVNINYTVTVKNRQGSQSRDESWSFNLNREEIQGIVNWLWPKKVDQIPPLVVAGIRTKLETIIVQMDEAKRPPPAETGSAKLAQLGSNNL